MSDLMREDFVQWLRTRPEVLNVGFDPVSGRFVLREDQERWEAWQASRECLVIELPEKAFITDSSDMFGIGSNGAINKCREAIHATGVKTK